MYWRIYSADDWMPPPPPPPLGIIALDEWKESGRNKVTVPKGTPPKRKGQQIEGSKRIRATTTKKHRTNELRLLLCGSST
jgi:hypothetical protein